MASLDPQPTHGLPTLNHFRMYDGWLAVHREGDSLVRLRDTQAQRADLTQIPIES